MLDYLKNDCMQNHRVVRDKNNRMDCSVRLVLARDIYYHLKVVHIYVFDL